MTPFSNSAHTPTPNLSKHGHDLSFERQFSCMPAQLLPVFKTFLYPGDKVKVNSSTFIRTEAISSSAFVRIFHHNDWFGVPVIQLFRFWNEFFNGTNDYMTSFALDTNGTSLLNIKTALPGFSIFSSIRDSSNSNFLVGSTPSPKLRNDRFGIPLLWNAARLIDLMGYGATSTSLDLHPDRLPDGVLNAVDTWNPLYFLAYHKIFHSHYMNTDYFKNDPSLYNIDRYFGVNSSIPDSVSDRWISTIHYRPYRPDFFTNQQPSPLYDNKFANFITYGKNQGTLFTSIRTSFINQDGTRNVNATTGTADGEYAPSTSSTGTIVSGVPNSPYQDNITIGSDGTFTTADLRSLFALEKLSRITASTGSHYYDQTLAHFGYKIPRGISDEAIYIGSQVTPIQINEVVATASTLSETNKDGSLIGDIAGKGFSGDSHSQDLEFEAPCECILMCISSISIEPVHASIRTDVDNRYINSYDFYHPEFDNLGLQPFFNSFAFENSVSSPSNFGLGLGTIGWQYRWSELKSKYNVVNESMFATSKNIWVGYRQASYEDFFSNTSNIPIDFLFYICPQYLNNIFVNKVPYFNKFINNQLSVNIPESGILWDAPELQPNYMYASDNFLLNMHIKCFKSSVMSPNSLPKLGL